MNTLTYMFGSCCSWLRLLASYAWSVSRLFNYTSTTDGMQNDGRVSNICSVPCISCGVKKTEVKIKGRTNVSGYQTHVPHLWENVCFTYCAYCEIYADSLTSFFSWKMIIHDYRCYQMIMMISVVVVM